MFRIEESANSKELLHNWRTVVEMEQDCRAELREKFIRMILALNDKSTSIHMHENTNISAKFLRCNVNVDHFIVGNLETPLGCINSATLRSSDIICFDFDLEDK